MNIKIKRILFTKLTNKAKHFLYIWCWLHSISHFVLKWYAKASKASKHHNIKNALKTLLQEEKESTIKK